MLFPRYSKHEQSEINYSFRKCEITLFLYTALTVCISVNVCRITTQISLTNSVYFKLGRTELKSINDRATSDAKRSVRGQH